MKKPHPILSQSQVSRSAPILSYSQDSANAHSPATPRVAPRCRLLVTGYQGGSASITLDKYYGPLRGERKFFRSKLAPRNLVSRVPFIYLDYYYSSYSISQVAAAEYHFSLREPVTGGRT